MTARNARHSKTATVDGILNAKGVATSLATPPLSRESSSMDGSFACPECGSSIEVDGLAPGRQVRCGFCNRLLEVPFLPRAADPQWKRRRFTRPRWFVWTCGALAIVARGDYGNRAFRFLTRQYDSAQQRSINQLLDSSQTNEADGRLDLALIDLDTAIEMARKAGPPYLARIDDWARKRPELAAPRGPDSHRTPEEF